MSEIWGKIKPKTVSSLMTFDANTKNGSHPKADTMAGKQAEGTAFLWNTLCDHNIALLADEVGMGKTFQAIGICCLLWRSKPNARILVLTPNGSICNHWGKEYRTFIKDHYLEADNIVKAKTDNNCINQANNLSNLQSLLTIYKDNPFLLGKISSLSHLTKDRDENDPRELYEIAKDNAVEIRDNLYKQKESDYPFDLIIIDEAQYFRTYGTGTQKNHAAQGLFGHIEEKEEAKRLADKVLLLTATPSHRSMNDITNQ